MRLIDSKDLDLHKMHIIPNGGWLHGDESHGTIRKNHLKNKSQSMHGLFTDIFWVV